MTERRPNQLETPFVNFDGVPDAVVLKIAQKGPKGPFTDPVMDEARCRKTYAMLTLIGRHLSRLEETSAAAAAC